MLRDRRSADRSARDLPEQRATTLTNRLDRAVSVEVAERLPVSADDRIRVSLDRDDSTSGYREDEKERGVLRSSVTLAPGAARDVVLRYRVRAPQDLALETAVASR